MTHEIFFVRLTAENKTDGSYEKAVWHYNLRSDYCGGFGRLYKCVTEPLAADFLSAASDLPGFIDESNTGGGDSPGFEELFDSLRDALSFDFK